MAWSIAGYNEFLADAREVFGLDYDEARYLYREMRDALESGLDADDLRDYADLAADIIEPFLEEAEEEYPEGLEEEDREAYDAWVEDVDDRTFEEWYDDEWVDEGDEMELTGDLSYKETT